MDINKIAIIALLGVATISILYLLRRNKKNNFRGSSGNRGPRPIFKGRGPSNSRFSRNNWGRGRHHHYNWMRSRPYYYSDSPSSWPWWWSWWYYPQERAPEECICYDAHTKLVENGLNKEEAYSFLIKCLKEENC